jgi:hypothetical protein
VIETQDMHRADDPRTRYEIHLGNAKEVLKVLFYADGTIISRSAKPKSPAKKVSRPQCLVQSSSAEQARRLP